MSKPRSHRKAATTTKDANQNKSQQPQKSEKQASWAVIRGLLTCRDVQVQQQQKQAQPEENSKKCKKMRCSSSLYNNTKVMDDVPKKRVSSMDGACNKNDASSSISMKAPQNEINGIGSASSSSNNSSVSGSFKGMPFRKLSGCYECRTVVDPVLGFTSREPSLRGTIWSCPDCDEIFMKAESLEHHQAVKHAISELGPEDTSKNILEIIFHSSWLKKQPPICKIDRILKVHNTQKTICRFEEYRDSIKAKATKHPRCIADGNELLRFHCTTFVCSLGLNGSSNLCNNSTSQCKACNIIKSGFKVTGEEESNGANKKGILTTATSGRAHDKVDGVAEDGGNEKKAMLVCRVIAGRVRKNVAEGGMEEYDSVAEGAVGAYSSLDELYVFNHRAILPCFVVVYRAF